MSKYHNEILNRIYEYYSKFKTNNTLTFEDEYLLMMRNGAKIHIKKENIGKFSKSAKNAGQSVQEHAKSVVNNPNATTLQKRRAQFAINSKKWNHKK